MRETKELYRSPEGNYAVEPAPSGYVVVHVGTGARVAWCQDLEAACVYAESRELRDADGL